MAKTNTKAPETETTNTKAPETKAPETKAPETKAPETKAPETKAPETVKIRVPKIEGQKGDLTVGWNGKMYKIKRGVTVEVPVVVAKIIEFSESVQEFADRYEESVEHE